LADRAHESPRVRSQDDLLEPFFEAMKPRGRWRIGTEAEKPSVRLADQGPVAFEGPTGVRTVLAELAERHGWFEESEVDGGEVIALRRGEASITLEPGAQLELSGAPIANIHQTCAEFRGHVAELREIAQDLGIVFLGLGFHPLAKREELPWVPKLRYAVMREYLPTRGSMALDMMLRTCTVQANLDYASEADAVRKMRIALAVQPIVTAMFANSPFVEGKATGGRSYRAKVWLNMDPDRSGLLPFAWRDDFSIARYVEWALDVPMFMLKRDGKVVRNTGQSFRALMQDGFEGHHATRADWETHLNTLFPEVRLKKIIEMRGADAPPSSMICALPALWKGLLYDEVALRRTEELASRISYEDAERARPDIAERALRARLGGRDVGDWASDLMSIAMTGLAHQSNLNRSGEDERVHLAKLDTLLSKGQCPADALLAKIDAAAPLGPQLVEHTRV